MIKFKKIFIAGTVILTIGISVLAFIQNKQQSENINPKAMHASYLKFFHLKELKQQADTIVEIEGTDKYEIVDDAGIKSRITTVKVNDVIRGNKDLKELKIIQTEGLNTEKPPANGEQLLMFLRNNTGKFKDIYTQLGGTQGTFKIKDDGNNLKHLERYVMDNDSILQDLSGNYDTNLKNKIKE